MNLLSDKQMPEYNFMKKNWKLFLCRFHLVPDCSYIYQKTGECFIMMIVFVSIPHFGPLTTRSKAYSIANQDTPLIRR